MVNVIKANGHKEQFNEDKLLASIKRARIPGPLQNEALEHIRHKLYEGISTSEIYQHILEFLDQSEHPYVKARYSLKEAIMMLGPTGYPFEDFVARILETAGYQTRVRQVLMGKCVSHEIDVIADKDGESSMIEVKFHNNPGIRSEVQVALYTQARFQDIRERNNLHKAWIVTNTKTTIDVNTYAQCTGMKVISWSYPEGEGLRDLIEKSRLHPITMLTSLSQSNKTTLLDRHIILCKEIQNDPTVLNSLPLSKEDRAKTLAEVAVICNNE